MDIQYIYCSLSFLYPFFASTVEAHVHCSDLNFTLTLSHWHCQEIGVFLTTNIQLSAPSPKSAQHIEHVVHLNYSGLFCIVIVKNPGLSSNSRKKSMTSTAKLVSGKKGQKHCIQVSRNVFHSAEWVGSSPRKVSDNVKATTTKQSVHFDIKLKKNKGFTHVDSKTPRCIDSSLFTQESLAVKNPSDF